MKNLIFFVFLFYFFLPDNSYSQGAKLQASITMTSPNEAIVKVRPVNNANSNNSSSGCTINVGVGIPKVGSESAPVISIVPLIGGTLSNITVEELTVSGVVYWAYAAVIDGAGFAPLNAGVERDIYKVVFPPSVAGRYARAIHSKNTNNLVEFDMFWPGSVPVVINPERFYGGSVMDNNDSDGELYVEALTSITLPISLISFNVTKYTLESSLLTWSTSSEINSDYFNIERSPDGNKWETIGKVDAAGNSNRQNNYEFLDENLKLDREENIFFYRLKMLDLDGAYKYSQIRNILFANDKNIVQVFPNPTKEILNLDLSVLDNNKGEISIIVIDQAGRNVLAKKEADNSLQTISLKDLPVGNYNVIVKQNEDVYLNKIVKIK